MQTDVTEADALLAAAVTKRVREALAADGLVSLVSCRPEGATGNSQGWSAAEPLVRGAE